MGIGKQILYFLLSVIIGLILAVVLTALSYVLFFDIPIDQVENSKSFIFLSQGITSIGIFISPYFTFKYILKEKSYKPQETKFNIKVMLIAILFMLITPPMLTLLGELNSLIDWTILGGFGEYLIENTAKVEEMTKFLALNENFGDLLIGLIVVAVIPAIGEELFFRSFIQRQFIQRYSNPHVAVILTGIIFGSFHMNTNAFLPLVFMGIFLGYIYLYSKNIIIPIVLHFLNNSFYVIYAYIYGYEEPELIHNIDIYFYLQFAITLILFILGLRIFRDYNRKIFW